MPKKRTKSQHPFQVYLRALSPTGREALATACGTTYDHLRRLCGNENHRRPSIELAMKIADHTGLDKSLFRPDVWEPEKKTTRQKSES